MQTVSAQLKPYSLHLAHKESSTLITLQLMSTFLNTKDFPKTSQILLKNLPTIFKHRCFNYKKQRFYAEAKQTEIGHLFEHILLEYLLIQSRLNGEDDCLIKGKTSWDWTVDQKGTFNIVVNVGLSNKEIFDISLIKSIQLLELILSSQITTPQVTH